MKGLTPKQKEILEYIEDYIAKHHYSPSYREIMENFAYRSTGTVYKLLEILKRKGAITAEKKSRRSITTNRPSQNMIKSTDLQLPLIGYLFIGYPLELFDKPRSISVAPSLAPAPDQTYVLQVHGDALHDEWILDGDFILIEARQEIEPGEIILGVINQQNTVLKKYFPEGQNIRLESQQSHIRPLTIRTEHIVIQGVLVGLFRVY